jgi:hypothetical protein
MDQYRYTHENSGQFLHRTPFVSGAGAETALFDRLDRADNGVDDDAAAATYSNVGKPGCVSAYEVGCEFESRAAAKLPRGSSKIVTRVDAAYILIWPVFWSSRSYDGYDWKTQDKDEV